MVSTPNAFGPIARPTTTTSPNSVLVDESRFLPPSEWEFDAVPPRPMRQGALGPDVWQARMPIRPYRQSASRDPLADVPTGAAILAQLGQDREAPVRDLSAAFDAVL